MRSHVKLLFLALLSTVAVAGLVACSSAASSSAASSSGSGSSSSSAASSDIETVGAESVFDIMLDYNAGTGYQWTYTADTEGVLMFVEQFTEDKADPGVVGGPLREHFVFRSQAPGEVVLTFKLARSWETGQEPAETQVYAFTVDKDLQAVLDPAKSNYKNAPEYGSNS